jgi:hypothetical protein
MGRYQLRLFAPFDAMAKYADFIQGMAFSANSIRPIISTMMFAQMAFPQVLLGLFCVMGEYGDLHERGAMHESFLEK